ncbi:MAG TPA: efflux RND transporter periplasmic adaptor subunit [Gemmatimonadaceae bacterium]|nr:efflux RND transporter periplasmic adaptor subunit [Gemmatimonadaceae bacterium]
MSTTGFRSLSPLRSAMALLLAGWLVSGCEKAQSAPPPPQVTVAPAITRTVADEDEFTGHFESVNSVEVRPRVGGFVERVAFTEGAIVHQGDVLFTVDARPYEAEVARAEAALAQARTRKELADMELERAQRLVSTQAISREELDARTSGRAESDAAIKSAEAALRLARLNLDWTVVRAPITGRVSRAEVTSGNLVQAGPAGSTLLTTIVSMDPIYVYFDSDEQAYLKYMQVRQAGARAIGRTVYVGLASESGFPHEGAVDFVDNQVDRSAGTIRVRAVLPNKSLLFTPGLFARVRLVDGNRHDATLIQDRAIGTDQDRKFVLVLNDDNTLAYRPIVIGRLVDGLRTVESGLKPGERVVVNGQMRVRPGMKVVAQTTTMTTDVAATKR